MREQIVDTSMLLFFLQNHSRLPRRAARLIEDASRRSLVSMASLWEISIKASLGKLAFDPATDEDLPGLLRARGFHLLPIDWPAMRRAAALPWHHRDPFDRLLVAEAVLRRAPILSTDAKLDAYEVERIGD